MHFKIFIILLNFGLIYGQLSCVYNLTYSVYGCHLSINNPNGLNNFGSISGTHMSGKTDNDVLTVFGAPGSTTVNIPSIICQKFRNLGRLAFSGMGIKRIDDYSVIDCLMLNQLDVAKNQITDVNERSFTWNSNLKYLYLDYNQLTTLPENVLANLNKLESLSLGNNKITDLPRYIFKSLVNLSGLYMNANQLTTVRKEWFETLASVRLLYLQYNYITSLPKNAFSSLKEVYLIWLQGNNLRVLHADSFGCLPKLTDIYTAYNMIDAVDENIIDQTGLKNFDLVDNVCANRQIVDNSVSRDYMRAQFRQCFQNYESMMSVCRHHSLFSSKMSPYDENTYINDAKAMREKIDTLEAEIKMLNEKNLPCKIEKEV